MAWNNELRNGKECLGAIKKSTVKCSILLRTYALRWYAHNKSTIEIISKGLGSTNYAMVGRVRRRKNLFECQPLYAQDEQIRKWGSIYVGALYNGVWLV